MKVLTLDDKEFEFLNGIFTAAYENREELKVAMQESPANQIFQLLEKMAPISKDKEILDKFAKMKAEKEEEDRNLFKILDSLHIKFSLVSKDS